MKRFPWLRVALGLSLALNLFLVALIGAHMVRVRQLQTDLATQTPLQRTLINAESVLSPADRATFDKELLAGEPSFGPAVDQIALARHRLAEALLASPYNPAATAAALDDWQASWARFQSTFRTPLLSALGNISPEGRRALVEARRRNGFGMLQ